MVRVLLDVRWRLLVEATARWRDLHPGHVMAGCRKIACPARRWQTLGATEEELHRGLRLMGKELQAAESKKRMKVEVQLGAVRLLRSALRSMEQRVLIHAFRNLRRVRRARAGKRMTVLDDGWKDHTAASDWQRPEDDESVYHAFEPADVPERVSVMPREEFRRPLKMDGSFESPFKARARSDSVSGGSMSMSFASAGSVSRSPRRPESARREGEFSEFSERRASHDVARTDRHGDTLTEWTATVPRWTRSSEESPQASSISSKASRSGGPCTDHPTELRRHSVSGPRVTTHRSFSSSGSDA